MLERRVRSTSISELRKQRFNGAAPLLERRLFGSFGYQCRRTVLQRGRSIAGAEMVARSKPLVCLTWLQRGRSIAGAEIADERKYHTDLPRFNGAAPLLERRFTLRFSAPEYEGIWLQRGRSIAGAEIAVKWIVLKGSIYASTGPLHCWSGDNERAAKLMLAVKASTGPLHCWSGDSAILGSRRQRLAGFNGAAPLLERRFDRPLRRQFGQVASTGPLHCWSGDVALDL